MAKKIEAHKSYSAREAILYLPGMFKTEAEFRSYLRADMEAANIFNAKIYTTSKLSRFVIRGNDLLRGLETLQRVARS